METLITRFEDGTFLVQDTKKMKSIKNEVVDVVVEEYHFTKEKLSGILSKVGELEAQHIKRNEEIKEVEPKIEQEAKEN